MPEWIRIRISQVLVKRLRDEYLASRNTLEVPPSKQDIKEAAKAL